MVMIAFYVNMVMLSLNKNAFKHVVIDVMGVMIKIHQNVLNALQNTKDFPSVINVQAVNMVMNVKIVTYTVKYVMLLIKIVVVCVSLKIIEIGIWMVLKLIIILDIAIVNLDIWI